MKSILFLLAYSLFFHPEFCKDLKIKIVSATISTNNAYNRFDEHDNGGRELTLTLSLKGKLKTEEKFKLTIKDTGTSSAPVILPEDEITITPADVKKGRKEIKVKVKLKPLVCLLKNESFKIALSCLMYKNEKEIESPEITINSIPVPATNAIRLIEGESIVKPFIKGDDSDDGNRTVYLKFALLGRKSTATDTTIHFYFPGNLHVSSAPALQGIDLKILRTMFSDSGCAEIVTIPVSVKLKAIDSLPFEEQLPITPSVDTSHSQRLIIRKESKPSKEPEDKKTVKNAFTHGCAGGHIFIVAFREDSTGKFIEVTDEKDKKTMSYRYENYFHTANFITTLIDSFHAAIRNDKCEDCSACANYIAERVLEELHAMKDKAQDEAKPVSKVSEDKKDSTATKSTTAADSSKPEKAKADTFTTKLAYEDSLVFTLSVIKSTTGKFVKLCGPKDPAKCKDQELAVLDTSTLAAAVNSLLVKLTGREKIDNSKINPSTDQLFADYKKEDTEKHPPAKSAAETGAMAALAALNADSLTNVRTGRIYLADTSGKVKVFSYSGKFLKEVKIDSITFSIEEGKIVKRSLMVFTAGGIFTNRQAPIPVRRINDRHGDLLDNLYEPGKTFVRFGALLRYHDYGYVPDDQEMIVLNGKTRFVDLSAANNLNSLVNFSIFTDLPALLGRRPNGLINTDVSTRFITNTGNWPNRDITMFGFMEANVQLSKFDNKFISLDSSAIGFNPNSTDIKRDTIDRMRLMQNAWLKAGVKFNVFSFRTFSGQYLRINVGAKITVTNADSLYKKQSDVIGFEYYPELSYSVKRLKNFGVDLSLKWIVQVLSDKERFINLRPELIFNPHVLFSYYPNGNPNKQVYLRFNYFAGHSKEAQNFYQLQFGWKTGLKLK